MDKKEEIAKGILAIKETSNALEKHKDIANKIVDFGSNMGNSLIDIYKMNAEYNADIKKLEIQSRERIAEMTMRYQLCRDGLDQFLAACADCVVHDFHDAFLPCFAVYIHHSVREE